MKISPQIGMLAFGVTLAAGTIYLVKSLLDAFKDKLDEGADKIGDALIDPLAAKIAGPLQSVADGFVLPGGRRVTFDQLIASGGKLAGDQTLVWQGVKYRLTMRNPDGSYQAERA